MRVCSLLFVFSLGRACALPPPPLPPKVEYCRAVLPGGVQWWRALPQQDTADQIAHACDGIQDTAIKAWRQMHQAPLKSTP